MSSEQFFEKPYSDRQLIVFADDAIVEAKEAAGIQSSEKLSSKTKDSTAQVAIGLAAASLIVPAASLIVPFVGGPLALIARSLFDSYGEAKKRGLEISLIRKSWTPKFKLLPGHPRNQLVYVGHPVIPNVYIPSADFHRFTFEHKFSEILSILMHLGATRISVHRIQGWGTDFSGNIGVGLPRVELGVQSGRKDQVISSLLYDAEFSNDHSPVLPDSLVWFYHESTWQQVADGRLKFGLKNFSLNLQYKEDYGVNAGFKMKVENAGFDLGGEFESHQSTVWKIEGAF